MILAICLLKLLIVAICGGLGSGKTLLLTRYAYKEQQKGKKIFSNYGLKFKHTKINLLELIEMKPDLQNSALFMDEMYLYMDSRMSMVKRNRLLSYFIFQTRKLGVTLYFTAQHIGTVDNRVRNLVDIMCICKKAIRDDWFKVDMIDYRDFPEIITSTFIYKGDQYYPLYKTGELIEIETT